MVDAYLSLGSNIGERETQLQLAIEQLNMTPGIRVKRVSPIYETKPVGYVDQPDFLNLCVSIETNLPPFQLLQACLEIETRLHRVRKERWGPRTIDIDILLYGKSIIEDEHLSIPHPRMSERAFVMIPLNDIASDVIEPRSNKLIRTLVQPDDSVVKYK
ncbi:2-amino-4-hydroxy-6-hydroxymethyldihydropteridine diphosphokinase [Staphylococcus felis]|uniref:2-amino-4-hydroxy-6-hydroxymethyldihydropteridine diphosphokinase n=1 Tax=Staphylococcus felis TaxID=46127 RepID=A0A2K3ZJ65_9STAP|nr:2-amino-4-hydroxy-6-hydroxymethyldihydropteridine diphosphokinase [Staphylococcus felis]AVP35818.1 2-amino-4-hydroxy-6-hydroxymethyldihydropteridine diphosphokinase [Staphylococcus felis]MDQ7192293.1 2-amino-4-hydroxy-6-hydroxymethyldihydropteridine diphosphokinase [Staphylococcus felis]PNZ37474.1 2-amino-4-hydroxy-6-hydroxymethyldihydropteridine diphosphokinase [Staphylococcus felis]QQB04202.1 2-amino-4-hydroxy-6-hydroxymethyldihydropteridine diphosphokinase [Staphylococcus felis]REH77077.